jgi:hypothetical protein
LQQSVPPQRLLVEPAQGSQGAGGAAFHYARGFRQVEAQLASAGEIVQASVGEHGGLQFRGERSVRLDVRGR